MPETVWVHGTGELAEAIRQVLAETGQQITEAPQDASVVWLAEDTPLSGGRSAPRDPSVLPGISVLRYRYAALIIVSSQVPVGYTHELELAWQYHRPDLRFACIPENTRRGRAYADFRSQPRVVVGLGRDTGVDTISLMLQPLTSHVLYTDLETAEMCKHALNSMLGLQATWANALGMLCGVAGLDYLTVEASLRTDPRIGPQAYVAHRPLDATHFLRDVHYLRDFAITYGLVMPLAETMATSPGAYVRAE